MSAQGRSDLRGEQGLALIMAVLLLLLVTGIGISAIHHSGEDSMLTGSFRRRVVTFYAADAGIQFATNQVRQNPPLTTPFTQTLTDGTVLRSGPRTAGSAEPLTSLGYGPPPDGTCINVGASCYRSDLYRAIVAAFAPSQATAELEAQFSVVQVGLGGYR
jgi:type IV pilus assembly protein PilX